MGRSAADTPTSPEFLRVSDLERDRAVDELKQEFVHGRLSHDTFMLRMNAALGARNSGQLDGLLEDLPPRRSGLNRIRAAARRVAQASSDLLDSAAALLPAGGSERGPADDSPSGDAWYDQESGCDQRSGFDQRAWYDQEAAPPPALPRQAPAPPGVRPGPVAPSRAAPPSRAAARDGAVVPSRGAAGQRPAGPPVPLAFPRGEGATFTIGRHRDCDLHVADMSVSRVHAQLERHDAGGWLLSDLGSTNGTRLNGWRVRTPVLLRPGDQVKFGNAEFVIQGPGEAAGEATAEPSGEVAMGEGPLA